MLHRKAGFPPFCVLVNLLYLVLVEGKGSMIRERGCKVQVLAHKENPQRMLFTRDSKAVAMKLESA